MTPFVLASGAEPAPIPKPQPPEDPFDGFLNCPDPLYGDADFLCGIRSELAPPDDGYFEYGVPRRTFRTRLIGG